MNSTSNYAYKCISQQLQWKMSSQKSFNSPELRDLLNQFQEKQLSSMADPMIQIFAKEIERQRNMQKHQPSSSYLQQDPKTQGFEEYDALVEKINQLRGFEPTKSLIDVIDWNASLARNRENLFKRQKAEQKSQFAAIEQRVLGLQQNGEQYFEKNMSSNSLAIVKNQSFKQNSKKSIKRQFYLKAPNHKAEKIQFREDDIRKLQPKEDLNDTIIQNYLKIIKFAFLSEQQEEKIHFFSTYFFHKLLGDYNFAFADGQIPSQLTVPQIEKVKEKIRQNYNKIKRWTKNADIFEKDLLIFPINAFNHWFCVLVLYPNKITSIDSPCEFIYCDSMFQKKDFVTQALKEYLRLQLLERKGKNVNAFEQKVYSYQLLLPRQTNIHDCGLYMLAYIDELLNKGYKRLSMFKYVENRNQLNLFPRVLIFTMRQRLLRLITDLSQANKAEIRQICDNFVRKKQEIVRNCREMSYDEINGSQFQKYKATFFYNMKPQKQQSEDQFEYRNVIRFYLDAEINFYEKGYQ